MRSLSIAATGMMAQQLHVDVISNNIANLTTSGYKRRRPEFQDLLYQSQRRIGAASSDIGTIVPAGVQIGLGVKPAGSLPRPRPGQHDLDRGLARHRDPGRRAISSSSARPASSPTPATAASSSARTACWSPPTATP